MSITVIPLIGPVGTPMPAVGYGANNLSIWRGSEHALPCQPANTGFLVFGLIGKTFHPVFFANSMAELIVLVITPLHFFEPLIDSITIKKWFLTRGFKWLWKAAMFYPSFYRVTANSELGTKMLTRNHIYMLCHYTTP